MEGRRQGVAFGVGAYVLWGLFPLYFPLVKPAGALEILAHRIIWSQIAVAIVVVVVGVTMRHKLLVLVHDTERLLGLAAAGILVAANWGTYIYAVNTDHVIESSLGYFMTPLISALLGILVFHERLRRPQFAALGLGAAAVLALTIDYGRLPWIALTLASTFGAYGLVKKLVNAGGAESLAVETFILFIPALAYVAILQSEGAGTFASVSVQHALLLAALGPITIVPLLMFNAAVTRIPLTLVGMLQYLAPVLQFLIGLFVVGEAMPTGRWIGVALIWIALLVISLDAVRGARRSRAAQRHDPLPTRLLDVG